MAVRSYHEEEKQRYTLRLRNMLEELPPFAEEFFRNLTQTTSARTRLGYAYDLKLFFTYLSEKHDSLKGKAVRTMTIADLDAITPEDIDKFMEYITYYTKANPNSPYGEMEYKNEEKGKARKLAAIRSLYKFFWKREKITKNPAALVDTPKIHDKTIVRLEVNEVASLLDAIESGSTLTEHQKAYHEKAMLRDLAIVTLLVGTGMRVSECVGIDVRDINFDVNGVKVTRKGGNEVMLYFGEEVREALLNYIAYRKDHPPKKEGDNALFLSSRGTRITVRAVENLVKKYSQATIQSKKISPHKLRSTYGTTLYQETGDIYLVADVLGHADVNTTKKHYAELTEERRKSAAKYIKLRKD